MVEDDGQRICPFSLLFGKAEIYCLDGNVATWHQEIVGNRPCRAWSPEVKEIRRTSEHPEGDGYHYRPGFCMLIPASEPELKFIPYIDPLLSLLDEQEE